MSNGQVDHIRRHVTDSDHGFLDLAAMRRLLDAETGTECCPTCAMPFDKGKKRRLRDNCGHERCYTCMFKNEGCPLCERISDTRHPSNGLPVQKSMGNANLRGSEITLYGEYIPSASQLDQQSCDLQIRPKVKTNGHFTSFMQNRSEYSNSNSTEQLGHPENLPKTPRPSNARPPRPEPNLAMTQSCPTPPQSRRKFFLSPKSIRSPFSQRSASRQTSADSAFSDDECVSDKPHTPQKKSSVASSSHSGSGGGPNSTAITSTDSNMYMRLGLLLGDSARRCEPKSAAGSAAKTRAMHRANAASCSSLASYCGDTGTTSASSMLGIGASAAAMMVSTNTSPVSTLTGSSEDHHHHHHHQHGGGVHHRAGGGAAICDSVGSLMSMSISGQSNCSESSPLSRRHSVTTTQPGQIEDLTGVISRRTCVRRSARSGTVKGAVDPKIRFAQYRRQQLTFKPLFFEVPQQEPDPLFLGRQWLLKEIEDIVVSSSPGALITGNPGTGKTALILQLVEHSCFGRRRNQQTTNTTEPIYHQPHHYHQSPSRIPSPEPQYITTAQHNGGSILHRLADRVVAYHFCQADNNNTCLVPDFIHSLAAQLCQAPQLVAYRDYLLSEPHLQGALSLRECITNPDVALNRGILEPLASLRRLGKLNTTSSSDINHSTHSNLSTHSNHHDHDLDNTTTTIGDQEGHYVLLIDALCEAEYHRPDHGDTITTFLARHAASFPSWLKVVCTVRGQLQAVAKQLPYSRVSLDNITASEHLQQDIVGYISYRLQSSPGIRSNVTLPGGAGKSDFATISQHKFAQHLVHLCHGSFLFAKLTLDLLERGNLVAKSTGYKVLPVTLAQIYLLHFNLRFPTVRSFEKVSHILSVCLAALYPLTLAEIYYSVNSLLVDSFLPWSEFVSRVKLLGGFLVKRLDNTYMFFHPSFREWLIRRDEGESSKFLCDLRAGHVAIAFRLSRVQGLLDAEKTLELGHHVLKAHVYRNMQLDGGVTSRDLQAYWIQESAEDVSAALCTLRNIYSPNIKVSRLLLLAGASPNHITDFLGAAPVLCMCSHEGSVPMVALLLEFGANVELTNSQGSTALSLAAARGHCDVVRQLIATGASPGHTDTAGYCPLVHAARNGHLNVVGYLLACDWVLNAETDISLAEAAQQALSAAAAQGHVEIVEYLLDMAEVDVDAACSLTGETALTIAATNGCGDLCGVLLSRGACVSATNKREMSGLLLAVKEGHFAVAERLIMNYAALEQTDSSGRTALMLAASEGHLNIIELLLDKGACLEKQDRDGLTALCWSCLRGKAAASQHLLDRGALINHTDKTARTPLDLAAFQGNPATVQMLMERGAIIEHVDVNGMRPLDRAIGCRNVQVVQCFLKKGAKLGPATWAMAQGKPDILLILLNKLLEDGNLLYRKSRLREAAHRYQYALKKFPVDMQPQPYQQPQQQHTQEHADHQHATRTFLQLKVNFLLNYSRCKRKLNEFEEAVELANLVLALKPDSYEAYYASAKAKLDMRQYEQAFIDVKESLKRLPPKQTELEKILLYLKDQIAGKLASPASSGLASRLANHRDIAISVDTLHE